MPGKFRFLKTENLIGSLLCFLFILFSSQEKLQKNNSIHYVSYLGSEYLQKFNINLHEEVGEQGRRVEFEAYVHLILNFGS